MYKSTALIAHLFIVAKMHIKKAPLREQWSLDGLFAVLLDDLVPWQDVVEVLWTPLDVGVRQVLEEVLEVPERVQAVGLGSLDDTVDGGAGFGSFWGVAEQPILAADGEVADGALADVVRERGVAAFQEGLERFLAAGEALEGFALVVDDLGGDELDLCADLFFAYGRQGRAAALADALFFRQRDEAFLMRELRQKLSCMVLLLLAALMCGHLNARLRRILLRFDLCLVEETQLPICNLR